MIQRDILLDMTKEIARFIALLLGLLKKENTAIVEEQLGAFLQKNFGLTTDFSFEQMVEKYENKELTIAEIRGLLDLVIFRADLDSKSSMAATKTEYEKAGKIIDFILNNSTTFDFTLGRQKEKVEKNLDNQTS